MGGRASNHHIYLGTHWMQLGQPIKKKKFPAMSHSFFNSLICSPALLETTGESSISHKEHSTVGKSSSTPQIISQKPTSWWLWNWSTVDPESVSCHFFRSLSKKLEDTNEVGVSRNITLLEKTSPEEPDHSKDPCRNLYRSSEMSSEDFKRLQLLQEE